MSGYGGSTVILMVETEFPETIWFWRLAEFVRSRFKNPCSVNTLRVVEKDFWSLHSCEYTYTPVPLSTHAHMLKKHVLTALSVHKKLFFLTDNVFEILMAFYSFILPIPHLYHGECEEVRAQLEASVLCFNYCGPWGLDSFHQIIQ